MVFMKLRGDDNLTSPSGEPQGAVVDSAQQDDDGPRLPQAGQERGKRRFAAGRRAFEHDAIPHPERQARTAQHQFAALAVAIFQLMGFEDRQACPNGFATTRLDDFFWSSWVRPALVGL